MTATIMGNSDVDAITNLLRAGRWDDARAASEAALNAGDRTDAMLALAAMLAARTNDPAAAAGYLERLLVQRPNDRAARLNLAQALLALNRFDEVDGVCGPLSDDPAADRLCAFAAQQTGDFLRARALYQAIVACSAGDADSWANLGNVYDALGEVDPAIAAFERAITLRPTDTRFYLNLAGVLERADRGEARRRVMRDIVAIRPDDPLVQLGLGLAEAALENLAAAETALRRAIALAPDNIEAWLELGLILENNTRIDDLEVLVAAARPHIGAELALLDAWIAFRRGQFAEAKEYADTMPETLNPLRRFHLHGEIADRRGDPVAAFDSFDRMNEAALAAAPQPSPGPTYRESIMDGTAAMREIRPRDRVAPLDGLESPVFIVGFPRSGTTLLDTMLGGLEHTHVLEEQPLIPTIERQIGEMASALALDEASVATHRQAYFATLRTIAPDADGKRIIDKHPLHMARMPLVHALFPDARILFVERHPFDVVLSCFMANFHLNRAMRSFTTIQEAALTYDAVLTAWTEARTRLDLRVHDVRYERLVSSPEQEIRPAIAFIGASFNPAVLDTVSAAKTRGHVRTASYAQVGEAIYQRSVARWKRYHQQLEPVRSILTPWAERLGYSC